jgi:hypothetical protein
MNFTDSIVVIDKLAFQYPEAETRQSNSTFQVSTSGRFFFTDFAPSSTLSLSADSKLIANGLISAATANASAGGVFELTATSRLQHVLSTTFSPNTVYLNRLARAGALEIDASKLASQRPPRFGQEFVMFDVAQTLSGAFSSVVCASSGYFFNITTRMDVNSGHSLITATLWRMYPLRAAFSATGNSVRVNFPRPTNVPAGPCANLLASTSQILSGDATCTWEAADEFVIRAARIRPNAELRFVDYSIAAEDDALLNVTDEVPVIVEDPPSPPEIIPVIVAAKEVAFCSDLLLDGSGA